MRKLFVLTYLSILCFQAIGQNTSLMDSLDAQISIAKEDTHKVQLLLRLSTAQLDSFPETSLKTLDKALTLSKELNFETGMIKALKGRGDVYKVLQKFEPAVEEYKKALLLTDSTSEQAAMLLRNCGITYFEIDNYEHALECYLKANAIFEKNNNIEMMALMQSSIAGIYYNLEQYQAALKMLDEVIKTSYRMKDTTNAMYYQINKAAIFHGLDSLDRAVDQYEQAIVLAQHLKSDFALMSCYSGIGAVLLEQKKYKQPQFYLTEALRLAEKLNQPVQILTIRFNLGIIASNQKKWDEAILHLEEGRILAQELNSKENIMNYNKLLAENYHEIGQNDKAYEALSIYAEMYRADFNENNGDKLLDLIEKYKTDKKEKENQILSLENTNQKSELKAQRYIIFSGIGGGILLVIIIVVVVRSNKRQKVANRKINEQKESLADANHELITRNEEISAQRDEIERQRHIVVEKNQEIMESINYARRLQRSILPNQDVIKLYIPNFFVFYEPKDVVSGDFYFFHQKGDLIYLAAADCTGHGVPGAFVSIVSSKLLNQAAIELDDPGELLCAVNNEISNTFKKEQNINQSQDGMDIALCVIDLNKNTLSFSGANNPLVFVRDGELNRVKGTGNPIGGRSERNTLYESHVFNIQKGDQYFLFSDGFQDQFGGDSEKKYMAPKFRRLLHEVSKLPLAQREPELKKELDNWQGAHSRVDDVLVIGFEF